MTTWGKPIDVENKVGDTRLIWAFDGQLVDDPIDVVRPLISISVNEAQVQIREPWFISLDGVPLAQPPTELLVLLIEHAHRGCVPDRAQLIKDSFRFVLSERVDFVALSEVGDEVRFDENVFVTELVEATMVDQVQN